MTVAKLTAVLAAVIAGATITASGARLDFRVHLEQPGAKVPVQIHVAGDWISTISAVRPCQCDAALQLSNARVTGDRATVAAGTAGELQRRLERRFWATYYDNGSLVAIHFLWDTDPGDENLLQMIATEVQLVRSGSSQPEWTTRERDGAGSYQPFYSRQEPHLVTKRKVEYTGTDGVAGAPAGTRGPPLLPRRGRAPGLSTGDGKNASE